jgi:putative membrane protein
VGNERWARRMVRYHGLEPMTTASTARNIPFRKNRFLQIMCVLFAAVFISLSIHPVMVEDWWLENGMVFIFVGLLIATYRRLALSQFSYLLIFVYLCMHEWGAHYRYALDPIGEWVKQLWGSTRNPFDRWTHLAFGLMMYYPQREALVRGAGLRPPWSFWIPAILLLGYGAGYELVEALAAAVLSPEAAEAFLALQGDPWDTHKDMFMALAGAVMAMSITFIALRWRARRADEREYFALTTAAMSSTARPVRGSASGNRD